MTVQEHLKEMYVIVNDLIKFAEAKNAGLIAFNGAVIIGLLSLLSKDTSNWFIAAIVWASSMNTLSLFIALSSVYAQKSPKEIRQDISKNENLIFFGTIAHMTPEVYIERLKDQYDMISHNHLYERDLARQVIIVSQIAARKFTRFNWALGFTFAGILTPLAVIIHQWYFDPNRKAHGI